MSTDAVVAGNSSASTRVGPRVAIVGDSWIAALGCRRPESFGRLTASQLGASAVLDVAKTGQTVRDLINNSAQELADFHPDIVIACIGGTEALVHPRAPVQKAIERFFPERWHGVAGLDPRVKYVTKGKKLRNQRLESQAKVLVKRLILRTVGGAPRVPLVVFRESALEFLGTMDRLGVTVVLVGFATIDDRLFPGTNASVAKTNNVLRGIADGFSGVYFVCFDELDKWTDYLDDHLHLRPSGHLKIAAAVAPFAGEVLGIATLAGSA